MFQTTNQFRGGCSHPQAFVRFGLGFLKLWLSDKGWQVTSNWVWQIQGTFWKIDLNLPGKDGLRFIQHQLPCGWRWYRFVYFLNQDRHDNRDMDISLEDLISLKWEHYNRDMDASFRTLLLGAARSPAIFAANRHSNPDNFPTVCVWGCGQLGSWAIALLMCYSSHE